MKVNVVPGSSSVACSWALLITAVAPSIRDSPLLTAITGESFVGVTVIEKLPAVVPPSPSLTEKLKESALLSLPSWV